MWKKAFINLIGEGPGNLTSGSSFYVKVRCKVENTSIPKDQLNEWSKEEHRKRLGELRSMKKPNLMAEGGQITDNLQSDDHEMDMIGRIMKQRQQHYSNGGIVANGGEDDLDEMADGKPNNFDDLSMRDDLESSGLYWS